MIPAHIDRDALAAVPYRSTGHVHSGVPGTENGHTLAQIYGIRIVQVTDGIVDIPEGLSWDPHPLRPPGTGADEYGLIAVS